MAALASIADYELFVGSFDASESARLEGLLAVASDAVLAGAHGQNITSQTYEDVTLYSFEGGFYFPQRPVSAVASVAVDGATLTEGTDYRWTSGGNGQAARLIRRSSGEDSYWACAEVTVTYTAGWVTVPAQIRAAVCATAKGVYQGSVANQVTETAAGSFVETYPSNTLALLAMKLPPATQKVIDDLCRVWGPASVEMRR